MTELGNLILLRPWWLLALPAILGLLIWNQRRAGHPGDWQANIQPHLLAALTALGRVETGRDRFAAAIPFVVALLVVTALTGPAAERREAQTFRNLDGVIFVMDVSGSMVRDDNWTGVVNMARAGLSVLDSKPAALIVYAGDSYLASPLTTDHLQLGQTISLLDDSTVPDRGNRPSLALAQAADVLEAADILAGHVVLFTDGEGIGPDLMTAAGRLEGLNARLSVVVAETTVSGRAPIDPAGFDALARLGGSTIFQTNDLTDFMHVLGDGRGARLEQQDLRLLLLADYGRYILILPLLAALLFFRRGQFS